ncbi:Methyltransferase domain-containing protein [Colletotrichum asianum]
MSAQSFPQFPKLPQELRDQIWSDAVRPINPNHAGVHFFTVFNPVHSDEKFTDHLVVQQVDYCSNRSKFPLILSAPTSKDDTSLPSWNVGNPSTYAADFGLWTACRDSYKAIYKGYDRLRQDSIQKIKRPRAFPTWHTCREDCKDFPVTFSAANGDGSPVHLTVLPLRDLFVLRRFEDVGSISSALKNAPFDSPKLGYCGVTHVAVEFDPQWSVEGIEQCRNNAEITNVEYRAYREISQAIWSPLRPFQHLWMVDYRLRLKAGVSGQEKRAALWKSDFEEQFVFEGQGCKYYAVPIENPQDFCEYRDGLEPSNPAWIVSGVLEGLPDLFSISPNYSNPFGERALPPFGMIGILVCEYD